MQKTPGTGPMKISEPAQANTPPPRPTLRACTWEMCLPMSWGLGVWCTCLRGLNPPWPRALPITKTLRILRESSVHGETGENSLSPRILRARRKRQESSVHNENRENPPWPPWCTFLRSENVETSHRNFSPLRKRGSQPRANPTTVQKSKKTCLPVFLKMHLKSTLFSLRVQLDSQS
jgi:hypothetical protein